MLNIVWRIQVWTCEFRPQRGEGKQDVDMNEVISYPNKSFLLSQILLIPLLGEQISQSEHLEQFRDFGVALCLPSRAPRGRGRTGWGGAVGGRAELDLGPSQVCPEGNILALVGTSPADWSGPFMEVLWGGLVFAAKWMFLFQRCLRWWTFSIPTTPPPPFCFLSHYTLFLFSFAPTGHWC